MIKKKYRLHEKQIKKILQEKNPFFSKTMVVFFKKNNYSYSRFAIIIWLKSVRSNVERNFFRRLFYKKVSFFIDKGGFDVVFIVKKNALFSSKEEKKVYAFENTTMFLCKKIFCHPCVWKKEIFF